MDYVIDKYLYVFAVWKHIALSCCYTVLSMIYGFRLYHVDDIPSGMGGDALDFNKATAVG